MLGSRPRPARIPPLRRRDLPGIHLAMVVAGVVAALLPTPPPVATVVPPVVPVVVAPAPQPPVQVELAHPGPVVPRPEVLNALAERRTVALTFDDGPDPRWTPEVLAVLRRHGAVATFCMIAQSAAGHEALVAEVVDAGSRLCDHSRTHDEQLPDRPSATIDDEVVGAQGALAADAGGAPVQWFRAPGGNWSDGLTALSVAHGMQPLGWDVDPKDWERPGVDAIVTGVQQQLHRQSRDGAIILLHDGGGPRDETVAALELLIPWLAAQGYRFGFPVP